MSHDRQTDFLRNVERDVERHDARIAARRLADPHLDAQHEVLVLLGHANAFAWIGSRSSSTRRLACATS